MMQRAAKMTHASVAEQQREKIGLSETLVRVSVGIEDESDLLSDIEQGLLLV